MSIQAYPPCPHCGPHPLIRMGIKHIPQSTWSQATRTEPARFLGWAFYCPVADVTYMLPDDDDQVPASRPSEPDERMHENSPYARPADGRNADGSPLY